MAPPPRAPLVSMLPRKHMQRMLHVARDAPMQVGARARCRRVQALSVKATCIWRSRARAYAAVR